MYLNVYKEISIGSNSCEAKDPAERPPLCRSHLKHMENLDLASIDNKEEGKTEHLHAHSTLLNIRGLEIYQLNAETSAIFSCLVPKMLAFML